MRERCSHEMVLRLVIVQGHQLSVPTPHRNYLVLKKRALCGNKHYYQNEICSASAAVDWPCNSSQSTRWQKKIKPAEQAIGKKNGVERWGADTRKQNTTPAKKHLETEMDTERVAQQASSNYC